jgi:hypothetical protein
MCYPETSGTNATTPSNNPEEQASQVRRGESEKSRRVNSQASHDTQLFMEREILISCMTNFLY